MSNRTWISMACVLMVLLVAAHFLQGAERSVCKSSTTQRLVIKICNWDGVVPQKALDGFTMPKGKWIDYQNSGWKVESYLVAPNAGGSKSGFYAILKR